VVRAHLVNHHEPRFRRTGPEARREPHPMPTVIGKARNNAFRAGALKPGREATLRARCCVARHSSGTTTHCSSRHAAHPQSPLRGHED
jgi:hypothetical protein